MENCKGTVVHQYYCCHCNENQGMEGAEHGLDYSLNEQFTGKRWIDGKKIYQKTIDIGALPNNIIKSVSHGISNIDYIVDYGGIAKGTWNTGEIAWCHLPYAYPVEGDSIAVGCNEDSVTIYATKKDYWDRYKGYVTIYYTCLDR